MISTTTPKPPRSWSIAWVLRALHSGRSMLLRDFGEVDTYRDITSKGLLRQVPSKALQTGLRGRDLRHSVGGLKTELRYGHASRYQIAGRMPVYKPSEHEKRNRVARSTSGHRRMKIPMIRVNRRASGRFLR